MILSWWYLYDYDIINIIMILLWWYIDIVDIIDIIKKCYYSLSILL